MVFGLRLGSGLLSFGLFLIGLCGNHGAAALSLELRGTYHWQSSRAEFGGLSGLSLSRDGTQITTISDRGTIFIGDVTRADGQITDISITERHSLQDTDGNPPALFLQNAEALARDAQGTLYVAYEGWARVWSYERPDALPKWLHVWDRFWDLIGNTGFEALAMDAKGDLYVISEMVTETGFPAFRYDGQIWSDSFSIPQQDAFRISGADFGPDGYLYLVERKFHWFWQFSTRIRRLKIDGPAITEDLVLLESPYGGLDNSEGIDVWQHPDGSTIITLLSDDNFSPLQSTLVTEFELVDGSR